MKFTLSWLKEHLDISASVNDIAVALTNVGLEVESVSDPAAALNGFVVAEVIEAAQHPNADRLKVCKVNNGQEILNIVCGAPNCRTGLKTVLAPVGAVIPKTGEPLKKGKIRGEESNGMLCSYPELQIDGVDAGIIELPADATVGLPAANALGATDPVFEIAVTPNRADCAGIRGVARDLAAAGIGTLKSLPEIKITSKEQSPIAVVREVAEDLCPLFMGRMIKGVKNGPSPDWLQQQLKAIGLRPISTLVDITNYFTYDRARPLHVFDADKITGRLTVRLARTGETLDALNDKTYELTDSMVVIADAAGAQSVAGIVGGTATGCTDDTVNVFLEAALWSPANIARTGRSLQVNTDARYRFERGVDPLAVETGLNAATQMILELCGGTVSDIIKAGEAVFTPRKISYRPSRCETLGGLKLPVEEQYKILVRLGFTVTGEGDHYTVTPPSWRADIMGEADLVEEILRIHGLDKIPTLSLPRAFGALPPAVNDNQKNQMIVRRALAVQGLSEAVTWSFTNQAMAQAFGGGAANLQLVNPINDEFTDMRPTPLATLLQAAQRNGARGLTDTNLFEVGPAFQGLEPNEQQIVAGLLRTGSTPRHWQSPARAVTALDAKADVIAALSALGVNPDNLKLVREAPAYYHPGRSGVLKQGRTVVAQFGELHPAVLRAADYKHAAVAAEIFLDAITVSRKASAKPLLNLPALQAVRRDFAFIMDDKTDVAPLAKAIAAADKQITDVTVFDVYTGKGVEPGTKSVAIAVTLQPGEKAFTDAEIEAIAKAIAVAAKTSAQAELRG